MVRPACSSCAPDERHEQIFKRSAERGSISGARAAAARRGGEHVQEGHANAATQRAAIAGGIQRGKGHTAYTRRAGTHDCVGRERLAFGLLR